MWEYKAQVLRVIDGDTVHLRVDLGFTVHVEVRARLYGIDTPEMHGVKKSSEEYRLGVEARDEVISWLDKRSPDIEVGDPMGKWEVVIRSHSGNRVKTGKYGRWLVEIVNPENSSETLNTHLVECGAAERY